jgi:hypothetical protein
MVVMLKGTLPSIGILTENFVGSGLSVKPGPAQRVLLKRLKDGGPAYIKRVSIAILRGSR